MGALEPSWVGSRWKKLKRAGAVQPFVVQSLVTQSLAYFVISTKGLVNKGQGAVAGPREPPSKPQRGLITEQGSCVPRGDTGKYRACRLLGL